MLRDWHPNKGFDALINQIQAGVVFASYAEHDLNDKDTVDIATQVAMKSGIFSDAYKAWHRRAANKKTWADWQVFWRNQFRAARNFS